MSTIFDQPNYLDGKKNMKLQQKKKRLIKIRD